MQMQICSLRKYTICILHTDKSEQYRRFPTYARVTFPGTTRIRDITYSREHHLKSLLNLWKPLQNPLKNQKHLPDWHELWQ